LIYRFEITKKIDTALQVYNLKSAVTST